jgi:hypothetical protein
MKSSHRHPLLFLLLLLIVTRLSAQVPYGNEWINPQQTYLRIPVVQTGWYRLGTADLEKAGLPTSTLPPRSLQLFRRGQEVAIRVEGEADGRLDATDFIEFYGEKNDGALDSLLYVTPTAQPHTKYSLYSDTAAYFLTWRTDGLPGRRIAEVPSSSRRPGPTLTEYLARDLRILRESYPAGRLYPEGSGYDDGTALTPYDVSEGWTSSLFKTNTWKTFTLPLPGLNRGSAQPVEVELLITSHTDRAHRAEVWLGTAQQPGQLLGDTTWTGYGSVVFRVSLPAAEVPATGLVVSVVPRIEREELSVGYVSTTYPRPAQLLPATAQELMYLPAAAAQGVLVVQSTPTTRFLDVTDPTRPRLLAPTVGAAGPEVALDGARTLLAVQQPLVPANLRRVTFRSITSAAVDYLLITHPLLRQPVPGTGVTDAVQAYADYRASAAGGSFRPLVLNAQEVFDQFNYGEPGPHGIRRLITWLHEKGQLRHVFLIGQARDPQGVRNAANVRNIDMVPTAGWPGSDIALSMGLGSAPADVPLVPVGRLQAATGRLVYNYLQKVQQHEAQPDLAPWRKNLLHLSGGRSQGELVTFRRYVDNFKAVVDSTFLGPTVRTLSKQTDEPVEYLNLSPFINEGVALVTMFGHSSLDVTDIELGDPANDALGYRNKNRYPAVIMNGCALGNFYFGPITTSTRWINAFERGAVLFLAHTHNGRPGNLRDYTDSFYRVLADPAFVSQSFGAIQQEAIRRLMQRDRSVYARATAQQMTLQGDPAIRLFPAPLPDYGWLTGSLQVRDAAGGTPSAASDSLRVQAVVTNYGRFQAGTYSLRIRRLKGGNPLAEYLLIRPAVVLHDTLTVYLPRLATTQGGEEQWVLDLDPRNEIAEADETNNQTTLDVYVAEGRAVPLLPIQNATLATPTPELVAQVTYREGGYRVVFERDTSASFTSPAFRRDTVLSRQVLATLPLRLPEPGPVRVYWRVYIVGEEPSTARHFTYDPQGSSAPALPEGVAFTKITTLTQVPEGTPLQPDIFFENITDVAFRDSLLVVVRQSGPAGQRELQYRIPPVPARTTVTFRPELSTLGRAGLNRVVVRFNEQRLPEQNYTNNTAELAFEVVPDRVPPVLEVSVDGRRLTNGEAVSPQPLIDVRILDENTTLLLKDTTHVQLWLGESCATCPAPRRLWLRQAQWPGTPTQDFRLRLRPDRPLTAGTYSLRAAATDVQGNAAAPYEITFRVSDTNRLVSSTVSPVPALRWVKFEVELEGTRAPDRWRIQVTDLNGRSLKSLEQTPQLGRNEVLWDTQLLPTGTYLYRMEISGEGWNERQSGRLIKQ